MAGEKRDDGNDRLDDSAEAVPTPEDGRKLSRSTLLAGGAAAAASLSLGQVDPSIAAVAGRDTEEGLGIAPGDANALELVFKVDHLGERLTAYGYLTHIAGLPPSSLFSQPNRQDERTALFTVYSVTQLQSRSILEAVHALTVAGSMDVYLRQQPGASFRDSDSFRQGTLVASYEGTFQSIVTVTSPRKGVETLTGALRQTRVERFSFRGAYRVLGSRDLRLRLTATGTGRLLEPKQPRAVLVLAGNAVVTR